MEPGFVRDYRNKRLSAYRSVTAWMDAHQWASHLGAALLLALVTAALAQISIQTPLSPVPFTLQVFGVGLMGGLLGRTWGTVSAALYVALGVLGLPVFAGQVETFHGVDWLSGAALFRTSLSSWYLLGFIAQAFIVGAVRDARQPGRNPLLTVVAPLAVVALVAFALIDVYFLSDYGALYRTSDFPNAWFALLSLGVVAVLGSAVWLRWTRKARQERLELFFGNVAGLLVLYAIGALGFSIVWHILGYGALGAEKLLAFAVLPFIPVDLAKILLVVLILTLVRPTTEEIASAREPEAPDV